MHSTVMSHYWRKRILQVETGFGCLEASRHHHLIIFPMRLDNATSEPLPCPQLDDMKSPETQGIYSFLIHQSHQAGTKSSCVKKRSHEVGL